MWRRLYRVGMFSLDHSCIARAGHSSRHWPKGALANAGMWAAVLLLSFGRADATSYLPISDSQLIERSPLIVHGRVTDSKTRVESDGLVNTVLTVQVLSHLKGVSESSIEVVLPGGEKDGRAWIVRGVPAFPLGEESILFLAPWRAGTFILTELGLSKFDIVRLEAGVAMVTRKMFLAPSASALSADVSSLEGTQQLEFFESRIRGDGQPTTVAAAGVPAVNGTSKAKVDPGVLWVEWPQGGYPFRWNWNPGGASSASVVYDQYAGQSNLTGSDSAYRIQHGIGSWAAIPGVDIRTSTPAYGTTGDIVIHLDDASGGTSGSPCYSGSICPASGGTVGCGGPTILQAGNQTWDGRTYSTVRQGAIWMRAYSCPASSAVFEAVVAHEFGHVLGFRHSDEAVSPKDTDQTLYSMNHCLATMRTCTGASCGGGCGTIDNLRDPFSLGADDMAAAQYTYPISTGGGGHKH